MNENNLFSIDRLVEFGLSVNIASQMVQMMNESISKMHVPNSYITSEREHLSIYYVGLDNKACGPYSKIELYNLIQEKKINADTYIWSTGMLAWKKLSEIPEILKLIALTPPKFENKE